MCLTDGINALHTWLCRISDRKLIQICASVQEKLEINKINRKDISCAQKQIFEFESFNFKRY